MDGGLFRAELDGKYGTVYEGETNPEVLYQEGEPGDFLFATEQGILTIIPREKAALV